MVEFILLELNFCNLLLDKSDHSKDNQETLGNILLKHAENSFSYNGLFSHLDHISYKKIWCIIIVEISHGQMKTNLNSFFTRSLNVMK